MLPININKELSKLDRFAEVSQTKSSQEEKYVSIVKTDDKDYLPANAKQFDELKSLIISLIQPELIPFQQPNKTIEEKELKEKFQSLVEQWKEGTQFASTVLEMAMHPAYQYIIGMGPKVLPYILQRLSREQEHWFWALKAITSEDPVPTASRGNLNKMRDAWLQWGKEKGYEW